jgi:Domain of unknown function (DUF4278)
MTTLTFLGSYVSYQPTRIATTSERGYALKYRGVEFSPRQPIAANPMAKGLKFRGVAY